MREAIARTTRSWRLGPRFGSDLDISIEQNHPAKGGAILRILRVRNVQRWPEDGMRKWEVIFERALRKGGYSGRLFIKDYIRVYDAK